MSEDKQPTGTIPWIDLTVDDADRVRDFYQAVVGWSSSPVKMGEYDDYCMLPPGEDRPVTGICHARGENLGLPAQWLIYILVKDLAASIEACRREGGQILLGPKNAGPSGRFCVIRDPAGAVAALFEPIAQ